jgi:hypothetical protein
MRAATGGLEVYLKGSCVDRRPMVLSEDGGPSLAGGS